MKHKYLCIESASIIGPFLEENDDHIIIRLTELPFARKIEHKGNKVYLV